MTSDAPTLFDQLGREARLASMRAARRRHDEARAIARVGDPAPAQTAALTARDGDDDLAAVILAAAARRPWSTAFELADLVRATTDRWQADTIRTKISRLARTGALIAAGEGVSPSGRPATRYVRPVDTIDDTGGRL